MPSRVAIVSGASSGIGRALAERAVRAGWDVYSVGRRAERLDELARSVDGATGRLRTLALDLREIGAPQRIVRETLEAFGRIDVLANAAGAVAVGRVTEQSDDALAEQMLVHVIVPLALTREALPALRESRGQVIYFGSGVARVPVGSLGAYPPAKAAVRSYARIARNELRAEGIAVTYVDPGAVATEFMTRAGFAGPPPAIAAHPGAVAKRIFESFESRRAVVNAVPWQTFAVALAQSVPALTDAVLARFPSIVLGDTDPSALVATPIEPAPLAAPPQPQTPSVDSGPAAAPTGIDAALADQLARMAKFKLSQQYVRGLLVPGRDLELGEVAMGWAGMPNKHERALTNDVLDALAAAGYLSHVEPERYRVERDAAT